MAASSVLWTVGHGNRSAAELLALLAEHGVARLVDVRRYPGSRRNPQFGRDALAAELAAHQLAYEWWGQSLGGRRGPASDETRHPAWNDASFRAYADHMDRPEFRETFSHLLATSSKQPTAIMCAETLWWRCHRRLLSDAAVLAGTPVVHLVSPGRSEPHRVHPAARVAEDGWPVYDLGALPGLS